SLSTGGTYARVTKVDRTARWNHSGCGADGVSRRCRESANGRQDSGFIAASRGARGKGSSTGEEARGTSGPRFLLATGAARAALCAASDCAAYRRASPANPAGSAAARRAVSVQWANLLHHAIGERRGPLTDRRRSFECEQL